MANSLRNEDSGMGGAGGGAPGRGLKGTRQGRSKNCVECKAVRVIEASFLSSSPFWKTLFLCAVAHFWRMATPVRD